MQESEAEAGLAHEGMPAACISQIEGSTGHVLEQQLAATEAKNGVTQLSTSAVCAEPASTAYKDCSGIQSKPNLESRQRFGDITDVSASMLSPAVQKISTASPPVKQRQRLAPFLPIVEVSAAVAVSSSVAQENRSSTSKQQTGMSADTTARQSIFSFL